MKKWIDRLRRNLESDSDPSEANEVAKGLTVHKRQHKHPPVSDQPKLELPALQVMPGRILRYTPSPRGVTLICDRGAMRIEAIAADCVRVRVRQDSEFAEPFSYAVINSEWPIIETSLSQTDTHLVLNMPELACMVNRRDGRLKFQNRQGQVLAEDAAPAGFTANDERVLSRVLHSEEGCYGLAFQPSSLDLRGSRFVMWNTDPGGTPYQRGRTPMYSTIPFYLGVRVGSVTGLFWDNPSRGWVDVGAAQPDRLVFCAEGGELRYYQCFGPDVFSVLARYTELTGRMPLPPLWALGFHLSRYSYTPDSQVREIAKGLRDRAIPCDVIYLDIAHMDEYRVFTWHPTDFPDPEILLNDLNQQGIKAVAILDPGVKVDPEYEVYQTGLRDGMFLRTREGEVFTGKVWPGISAFPDFSDPRARKWWGDYVQKFLKAGIAGIWNDMNEPAIFPDEVTGSTQVPDNVVHDMEGQGAYHRDVHNLYGTLMARATFEALTEGKPNARPFNITRAPHSGAQRYALTWTGDNTSDWDHLRMSISMALNGGLAGMPFVGPDTGGYYGDAEPELYTRWIQLGAMLPFFRVHTCNGTAQQEPWAFGEPYESICRSAIELRYRLLPYLYSSVALASYYGWPIVRPLFMLDPADDRLRDVDNAFLLGESLLVAPILERGQTQRELYLPRGRWYDFETGQVYTGKQTIRLKAPLDRLPLLVRAGHVIPFWPVQQYVGEKPITELGLRIYRGDADTTLYEDAGEGNAYRQGDYRWLYFTSKANTNGGLSITWRRAGKYEAPYQKVRCEVFGIEREPESIQIDGSPAPLWYYERGVIEFTALKPFEQAKILMTPPPVAAETRSRSPFKGRNRH